MRKGFLWAIISEKMTVPAEKTWTAIRVNFF